MSTPFQGKIALDVRDSTPDWAPYLAPKAPKGSPNVLMIAWDDVGYGAMDVFGGPIQTPTMQRIADRGVRFGNFHTTALCSPTRASLLTGRNATTNGMATIAEFASGFPGISTRIPFESGFISEVLAAQGYNTYCIGKWHLTPGRGVQRRRVQGPLAAGSRLRAVLRLARWGDQLLLPGPRPRQPPDRAAGAAGGRLPPGRRPLEPGDPVHPGCEDDRSGQAVLHVLRAAGGPCPAPGAAGVGRPLQGRLRRRLRGDATGDPGAADRARPAARGHRALAHQPARRAGAHGPERRAVADAGHGPARGTPSATTRSGCSSGWPRCSPATSRYYDDRLGRILDYLEQAGELDNTIIVVVSDNGSSGEGGPNGTFNEWRFFNGIADTTELVLEHIDELGTPASNNHYNTGWAWALDTPFPYWKRWAGYEGGTADICLVSWPAGIPASDQVRHQYVHAVDVVPTLYDLLGITPPAVINGYEQLPIEGESFAAALTDPAAPAKSTQFFTMLGQRAIYHEGWLACTVHPPLSSWGHFDQDEWELYHLEVDRSQSTNLADAEPERLESMKALWFECADKYNGLPLDDRSASSRCSPSGRARLSRAAQFVFYPDCADVPESAGPMIPGRSYTIAAGVAVDDPGAEGVLWAAGGVAGGHSLYVKDGRLRYTFNWVGTYLQDVVAERDLTPGEHLCVAEFVATGKSMNPQMPGATGTLTLYVDSEVGGVRRDHDAAGLLLPHRRRHLRGPRQRLGGHPGVPAPFPFTGGMIDKVVVDLSGEHYVDHEAQVRGWFLLD